MSCLSRLPLSKLFLTICGCEDGGGTCVGGAGVLGDVNVNWIPVGTNWGVWGGMLWMTV